MTVRHNRGFIGALDCDGVLHAVEMGQDRVDTRAVCRKPYLLRNVTDWEPGAPGSCSACKELVSDVALRGAQPFVIEVPDAEIDADAAAHPEEYGDFVVTFSDEATETGGAKIDESLQVIQRARGVERAVREDRELIIVWGKNADLGGIRRSLADLWGRSEG